MVDIRIEYVVKIIHAIFAIEPKCMTVFVIHFVIIGNMNLVKAELNI